MAAQLSSADVLAINSAEEVIGMIVELGKRFPELAVFPASPVSKTTYKTIVRTADPTAGFRAINAGRTRSVGTIAARTVSCYFLDASWDADNAALKGIDWGDPIDEQRTAHFRAAMRALCSQIYYGTSADAGGFAGFNSLLTNSDDDYVIDAGGTTAATASSVWAVRLGAQDISLAWGNDGTIEAGPVIDQQLTDGSGNKYMGKAQAVEGYVGLQLSNQTALGRICNLTADTGKGLTDARIASLLSEFKVGEEPDALFMSRRSLMQLQQSRTATNPTGQPAPFPQDAFGIPIHRTESIVNTEALLTASGT